MVSTSKVPSLRGRLDKLTARVRKLETRRSLGNSSFDAGGLIVNPDGASVALRVDQLDGSIGGEDPGPAGVVAFTTATGRTTRVVHIDDHTRPPLLFIDTADGDAVAGGQAVLSGVQFGVELAPDFSTGGAWQMRFGRPGSLFQEGLTVFVRDTEYGFRPGQRFTMAGLGWVVSGSEWRAMNDDGSAYVAIRAAAFPTASSKASKQNITDVPFDALAAVMSAAVFQWEYKPDVSQDGHRHISPMADDLPAALVAGSGEDMTIDTRDMVGVLWAAIRQLATRVEKAEKTAAEQQTRLDAQQKQITDQQSQIKLLAAKLGVKL